MPQRDALNPSCESARGAVKKLHPNWDHTSARQLKRISGYAEGAEKMRLDAVGDVVGQCEARQKFE